MSRSASQMKVRLSQPLKDWVEAEATRNCRSKNAEIVFRLEVARLMADQKTAPADQGARP